MFRRSAPRQKSTAKEDKFWWRNFNASSDHRNSFETNLCTSFEFRRTNFRFIWYGKLLQLPALPPHTRQITVTFTNMHETNPLYCVRVVRVEPWLWCRQTIFTFFLRVRYILIHVCVCARLFGQYQNTNVIHLTLAFIHNFYWPRNLFAPNATRNPLCNLNANPVNFISKSIRFISLYTFP